MATLAELGDITNDSQWGDFVKKVRVACAIKAAAIIESTTPGATALDWAKSTISNPVNAGDSIAYFVVATNNSLSLAQIYGANDSAIQSNVNTAVDAIYGA